MADYLSAHTGEETDAAILFTKTLEAAHSEADVESAVDLILDQSTNSLLASNGYQVLAGGLIMQWGLKLSNVSANTAIVASYPIQFPNAPLSVVASHSNGGSTTEKAMINIYSASSVSTFTYNLSDSGSQSVYWQAIGY